jgi:hypothetical protein
MSEKIKLNRRIKMKDFFPYWKQKAQNKQVTAMDFAIRAVLLAIHSKSADKVHIASKFLERYFTPIKDENKLKHNGNKPYQTVAGKINTLHNCNVLTQSVPSCFNIDMELVSHLETAEEKVQFEQILHNISARLNNGTQLSTDKYVYIFVRQDMSKEYQVVQSSHVALKLGAELTKNDIETDNLYFVVCGADDLEHLQGIKEHIQSYTNYVEFIEPDLSNETTALATYPIDSNRKNVFKNYKLLKYEEPEPMKTAHKLVAQWVQREIENNNEEEESI